MKGVYSLVEGETFGVEIPETLMNWTIYGKISKINPERFNERIIINKSFGIMKNNLVQNYSENLLKAPDREPVNEEDTLEKFYEWVYFMQIEWTGYIVNKWKTFSFDNQNVFYLVQKQLENNSTKTYTAIETIKKFREMNIEFKYIRQSIELFADVVNMIEPASPAIFVVYIDKFSNYDTYLLQKQPWGPIYSYMSIVELDAMRIQQLSNCTGDLAWVSASILHFYRMSESKYKNLFKATQKWLHQKIVDGTFSRSYVSKCLKLLRDLKLLYRRKIDGFGNEYVHGYIGWSASSIKPSDLRVVLTTPQIFY